MDGGAWRATAHRVAKRETRLSDLFSSVEETPNLHREGSYGR